MKLFAIGVAGFALGTALIGGVAYIGDRFGGQSAPSVAVANGQMPGIHMAAGMSMAGAPQGALRTLTIIHIQRGCHTWTDGTKAHPSWHMNLATGSTLAITNKDVDLHKLMKLKGPSVSFRHAPLSTMGQTSLKFAKSGTYVFSTKSLPNPSMGDMPTVGPDNNLRLTVTVA